MSQAAIRMSGTYSGESLDSVIIRASQRLTARYGDNHKDSREHLPIEEARDKGLQTHLHTHQVHCPLQKQHAIGCHPLPGGTERGPPHPHIGPTDERQRVVPVILGLVSKNRNNGHHCGFLN